MLGSRDGAGRVKELGARADHAGIAGVSPATVPAMASAAPSCMLLVWRVAGEDARDPSRIALAPGCKLALT
jgi:hypothetical protein